LDSAITVTETTGITVTAGFGAGEATPFAPETYKTTGAGSAAPAPTAAAQPRGAGGAASLGGGISAHPNPPLAGQDYEDHTPILPFFVPVPNEYFRVQRAPAYAPRGLDEYRLLNHGGSHAVANFSRDQAPGTDVRSLTFQAVDVISAAGAV